MAKHRPAKPKTVSYELIDRDSIIGYPMYQLLEELVKAHHEDLREARIALAWCTSWKPDVDGHVTIGKCKKASDLDREISLYDFVILLRRSFWSDLRVTEKQRRALLDHELCHAAMKYDARGEPLKDERGRFVWRVKKHDVEEFTCIVDRYGCYKADLERFAVALRRSSTPPFKACEQCQDSPGWIPFTDDQGVARVKRCECFLQWSQQRELFQEATA